MPSQHIPIHSLKDINKVGLEIRHLASIREIDEDIYGVHRDDHYLFFFQQGGFSQIMVDFKEITRAGKWLFFILPGQVHQVLANHNCTGWFLAVGAEYLNETYRTVLDERLIGQQPIAPDHETTAYLEQSLSLLDKICNQTQDFKFQSQILRSLIDTTIGFFTAAYLTAENGQHQHELRPTTITRQFRQLLRQNFKEIKSPAAYASLLNISPAYLNEAVKQNTGFAISYWIHQEIILEAKRLLYYTNNSIKEIAVALGYADHAYFSRLFSKVVGQSPIQFRRDYHE